MPIALLVPVSIDCWGKVAQSIEGGRGNVATFIECMDNEGGD